MAGVEEDDASIVRRVVEEIFAPFFGGDAAPTLEQVALQPESAEPVLEPVGRSGRPSSRARSASNGLAAAVAAVRKGSRSEKPAVKDSGTPLPRDGCGEGCLNRLSFIHCDVKTCPCGERCSNRPFYQQEHPDVEVFLTTDKGWGVRAAESIPRGQFIAEYLGEVVDEIEMAARMEDARLRNEPHFYMMEMAPGMIIDARPKGNIARLLNSSCDPNCETQKWFDAATSEIRVGIFTLRDVAPGEELVYDYHFQQLFGLDGDEAEYSCKCGAANCRGSMDTQPERSKDFGRRVEVYWPEAEAYVAATVTGYIAGTKRHIIKYDNEKVEKVCLKDRQYKWLDGNGDSAPLTAPAAAKKTKRAATVVAPAIAAVAAAMDAAQPPSVAVTPAPDTAAVSAAASFAAPLDSAVEVAEVPVKRGRGRPSGTSLGKPPKPTRPPLMAQNGPAAAVPSQQVPQELLHLVRQIMPTLGEDVALDGHALHARLRPVLPAVMRQVAAVADSLLPTPGSDVWVPETGPNSAVTEPSVPAVHEADGAPGSDTDHMEIDAVAGVAEALVSSVEAAVMGPEGEETSVVAAVADALTSSVEAAVMASNKADLEKQGAADDGAHAEVRAVLESMVSRIAADADGEEPPRKRVAYGGPPLLAELRWAAAELDPCTASAMCSAVQGQLDALMKFLEAAALPNGNGVVVVDNHGAQHTAGKLHGNGRSAAPARRAPATSISGRGRKRQKKNFGDEYVQEEITFDHDNAPQAVAEVALDGQAPEPSSPPRPSNSEVNAQAAAATLSPGLEAAATIAALHNQVAEPPLPLDGGLGGRRSSLSQGAAGRRSLPTPGSTGLPARTILVAKRLTNSDVSKGRILLPRAAVEANLSFAIGRAHSLVAKDHEGQCWEFTLQSWANGIESRRVFVLEHAGDYVRRFALKPDDVIGISTNEVSAEFSN